jgi:putative inorganic carbon (hco3(-)) transporter
LLIVLPVVVAGVLGRGVVPRDRAVAAAVAVPLLLSFYYTSSRGGLLGLATGIAVYCWRRFGTRLGAGIAAAVIVLLIAVAPSRIGMVIHLDEVSAQGRLHAWSAGLSMLKTHVLTGVGWNRYAQYYGRPAHNSYLHAFAELGMLGGLCFVALVYAYFWGLGRGRRRGRPALPLISNLTDALYSVGAAFFVGAFFLSQQYSVMTFTVVALGAVYLSIATEPKSAAIRFRRREWLAMAAIAITILVAIWMSAELLAITGG